MATDHEAAPTASLPPPIAEQLVVPVPEAAWHDLGLAALTGEQDAGVDLLRRRLSDLIGGTGPGLCLQPITHLHSGVEVGAEALARFPGPLSTADWFRTAHALDAGVDLELRMLHEVVEHLTGRANGFVGVNLSPSALLDARVLELLHRSGYTGLLIELTDQTVLPQPAVLRARIDEVRRLGIRIGIHASEFGVDTMQLLDLVSPDVVKLDPVLTGSIAAGRATSSTARSFLRHCNSTGVFLVSVGAESRQQLTVLKSAGVDAYQGGTDLRADCR
jgi:EAL domain-containing protein (putative c-di-GMP-specific phosphodiesterase class I)